MCQKGSLNKFNVQTKNNLKSNDFKQLQCEVDLHAEANSQTKLKIKLAFSESCFV